MTKEQFAEGSPSSGASVNCSFALAPDSAKRCQY